MDVVDCGSSTTSSVSRRSSDDEAPALTSPELPSTSLYPHCRPATEPGQTAPDVRRCSRRRVEDGGQPVVVQGMSVARPTSTEAADPSRHHRVRPARSSDRRVTDVTAASEDDDAGVDVEDLSVVDAGIEDCLVTSLRAEVSSPSCRTVFEQLVSMSGFCTGSH